MSHHIFHTFRRIAGWIILGIIALIILIPALLYIPFVQDFAKEIALKEVKKSTGMDISISTLRLSFPLRLRLNDVVVLQDKQPDTMATLSSAKLSVRFLPLLKGEVKIGDIDIESLAYNMGTPDSTMYLRARISTFHLASGSYGITSHAINIGDALLDGADIAMTIKPDTVSAPTDSTASTPLVISANDIRLQRVNFAMQMLPTIDTLCVEVPSAQLYDATIDLGRQNITARYLTIDSVAARYLTPSDAWLKANPTTAAAQPADTAVTASKPWTIMADSLNLTARQAVYAKAGVRPMAGFDSNFIELSDVSIKVDSFYNKATTISVPIRNLIATERCGLNLGASGLFAMDSTRMQISDFVITAGNSRIDADAMMGMGGTVDSSTPVSLKANALVDIADIETALPSMAKTLRGIPRTPISVRADIEGSMGAINVEQILIDWPSYLRLSANGKIDNPTDFNKMRGNVSIGGNLRRLDFLKPTLLSAAIAKQVNLPPATIKGNVNYAPGAITGKVSLATSPGSVAADASWQQHAESYSAKAAFVHFPVQAFLPAINLNDLNAEITATGHGLDIYSPTTQADAHIRLSSMNFNSKRYSDIDLLASLKDGEAHAELKSDNPGADLDATIDATLDKELCDWNLTTDITDLNLVALGLSKETLAANGVITSSGTFLPKTKAIDATFGLNNLNVAFGKDNINIPSLDANFKTADSLTALSMNSGDLRLSANAYEGLTPLLKQVSGIQPFIDSVIVNKRIDVIELQRHIPQLDLDLDAGSSNPVAAYLANQNISFNNLKLTAHNDSTMAIHSRVYGLQSGKTRLDSISLDLTQHSKFLVYSARLNNKPGTLDDFAHVALNGFVADDKAAFLVDQHNIQGKQGFNIGMTADFSDSLVSVRLVPHKPMIAYQQWELNAENEVTYNFINRHIDANLRLTNGKSTVRLYTDHASVSDSLPGAPEDLVVQLTDINLADWLSISPFAPPIKGSLGADLRLRPLKDAIAAVGNVSLTDLYYGRERVGTFDLDLNVSNNRSKALHADIALMVDSVKVMTASGVINDSTLTNPFLLDFSMIRFPLHVINPFLPKNVAQLSGVLNGQMKITGSMTEPTFNGFLDFDSTAVKVGMTGVDYTFSEEKIPVDSNIVRFNDFSINGLNKNPLRINGIADLRHLTNIGLDLSMKANEMLIVDSSRPRGADIYGKGLIDINATTRGNLSLLNVDVSLALLPESNITYVMASSTSALASKSTGNMVQFVQFSDTTTVAADSVTDSSMALILNANVKIEEGSTINVDISADGKNKASIKGFGSLDYTLNPMSDGRLLGRFTINSGFVRYTPPLMSEKNFKFQEGSYINFSGDMLNPTLSIKAVDELKANVTQEGQNSRLVNFLITLSVSRTLQDMDVAFDLSTNDDLTIQNELASMSPEQRANQAMNMLLYNVYTGPGTKASANLSGNPLFSFLESQINSWAANNIRGVDISFGIDQYDKTTDGSSQTTTSYSYQVSKTLFNNRVKIVVGGNYSTDADADENFSQNLINDISFEYMLNRSGSMYVRLFRHVGYESILEGEVTQTGVGFVYRHKINSLRDLFHWRRSKPKAKTSSDK